MEERKLPAALETKEQESKTLLEEERVRAKMELYTGVVEDYSKDVGAEITMIENHQIQFREMIEEMFKNLPTETKILEGTTIPVYTPIVENELSLEKEKKQ
jgi:hypothetical protein